jgi:anti-anti-sigma factor
LIPVQNEPAVMAPETVARTIRVRRRAGDGGDVVAVSGEVDIASVSLLRSELFAALTSGAGELWIDLSDTQFMDSSGIHALLEAEHEARRRGRPLAIICPRGPVRRVLELTGLAKALPVHDDAGSLLRCAT